MDTSPLPPDDERELAVLRARAYGPDADIQTDPAALERLWQLEEALHPRAAERRDDESVPDAATAGGAPTATTPEAATAEPGAENSAGAAASDDPPRPRWRAILATRTGRAAIAAAAVLAAGYAVGWLVVPHPDATLHRNADEASALAQSMIGFLGARPVDSTIRGYDTFWGIEPWYFEDEQGFHCFMLVTRPGFVDGANCVPPGVELSADIMPSPQVVDGDSEPLPPGSIVRFHYLGDRVDAYFYPPADAD
jgi:hypothetical protein